MPSVLLSVPHFEQSRDGLCLPACTRMVLAYWGQSVSEAGIADHLQTKRFGTPISNITRLRQWGYRVHLGSLTAEQLKAHLLADRPVIARVWTTMLDYWTVDTPHAVVVIGFDETHVYLNDPALPKARQAVLWDGFLAAWVEFDETAAVIYPPKPITISTTNR